MRRSGQRRQAATACGLVWRPALHGAGTHDQAEGKAGSGRNYFSNGDWRMLRPLLPRNLDGSEFNPFPFCLLVIAAELQKLPICCWNFDFLRIQTEWVLEPFRNQCLAFELLIDVT